jgi:hypothetical protein
MVNCFYRVMLIPWQCRHDSYVCIPSIAMSGDGDGMDSTLEYILSDVCGFLLLCPFMPRPRAGNVYPLRGAPGHVWPGAQVSASGH